ncbi:LuxR family transcriptional regulator [Novimethylophilus kurashikiensis]|uniref:LuxR family transcriptional regulator n=1 Tax=Novimethylophilus kurashikiensis TaxID=1825523 RepID=A0A2R5F9H3_9PROT|nr:response regulator transcription factor [Novimethylophilus kurashikiensis]GBG14866.1 LuxR family transcriptional regulator [Novimethylophilus kurashikiensis]
MSNIIIIDDHPMLRNGIGQLFQAQGWSVVAEAGTAAEGEKLLYTKTWDLAVLDIHLPDRNGLEMLTDIRGMGISGPVLVHSMLPDSTVGPRVFKAGGNGLVNKGCSPDELVSAAKRVMAGGRYVSAEFADVLAGTLVSNAPAHPHESLSDREYQVMCHIANGKTPKQIAENIGCNVNTISTYRSRILQKLKLKTSMDIMRYALTNRLVLI